MKAWLEIKQEGGFPDASLMKRVKSWDYWFNLVPLVRLYPEGDCPFPRESHTVHRSTIPYR
jgi:hypothetical protein